MRCTCCDSSHLFDVLCLEGVPVFCNVLCASVEDARAFPRHDIRLMMCRDCGHLFNAAFDPVQVEYSGTYENALHFSGVFREYQARLIDELVDRDGVRGKHIVELGCGDASFLSALCEKGENTGIGYDPAFDPARATIPNPDRVSVRRELFTPATAAGQRIDVVCCRHVLEHIDTPRTWLRGVRDSVSRATRPEDALLFFEVPNAAYMLRELAIWDLIYEHCNYFTPRAMARAFQRAGFRVDRTDEVYSGQFLALRAHLAPANVPAAIESRTPEDESNEAMAHQFGSACREKISLWRSRFGGWAKAGKRVVLWGAGTKGVMLLNLADADQAAVGVVDLNPRKHGHFIAGTGQPILSPGGLTDVMPDVVVVVNPVYEAEIRRDLASHGLSPEVVLA